MPHTTIPATALQVVSILSPLSALTYTLLAAFGSGFLIWQGVDGLLLATRLVSAAALLISLGCVGLLRMPPFTPRWPLNQTIITANGILISTQLLLTWVAPNLSACGQSFCN
ncbi:hypothetical protein [Aestuariispira ectoiniformans]|uniref:hypothetical protein n=1 Tax=Aestuariispira ectoiniformans TaxID=2775080 RepID=UPI00223B6C35|nr:hypothetical protein [Aestuariispira ectoiniformans]